METLKANQINEAHSQLQSQARIYQENDEYVKGYNPTILKAQRKKDPDNRLPIPLAKSAVEDMTGYAGSDIVITYEPVEQDTDEKKTEEYQSYMNKVQTYNKDFLITTELYKKALSHREAYLLFWVSEELDLPNATLTPEYAVIGMDEMVVLWDNHIKKKPTAAIRFVTDDKKTTATVYYPGYSEKWEKGGKDSEWKNIETENYPYKSVPIAVFKISSAGGPLFQAEKPMIDKHDSVMSKSQNEMDRFNALLALFPDRVTPEFVQKMEELKVIDELGTYEKWPMYLEKNLQGVTEYTNNHLDRLERLFHKTIKVVDFNNIAVTGGDESGTARAFKLLGMEFNATQIEKYFNMGFEMRTALLNDVLNAGTANIKTDEYRTVVTSKRNLPVDSLVKLQIAQGLLGLGVRKETILKVLPHTIIEDPAAEIEAMEAAEKEQSVKFLQGLTSGDESQGDTGTDTAAAEIDKDVVLSGTQITSALKIVEAMKEGLIDRKTAINQIEIFFNISREKAMKIVGKLV